MPDPSARLSAVLAASAMSALLGLCSACATSDPDGPGLGRLEGSSDSERYSPLRFRFAVVQADWCPGRRAMQTSAIEAGDGTWALLPPDQFTVYVNDDLLPENLYRIEKSRVTVCLPPSGRPKVLIFGPDSNGLPAQFNSEDAQAVS